jgi:hypothetical protein
MRPFQALSVSFSLLALVLLTWRVASRPEISEKLPASPALPKPSSPDLGSETTAATSPASVATPPATPSLRPADTTRHPRSIVRPPGLLGGGQPVRLEDIPAGTPLRESLDRLSPAVLAHALERLSALTFNVLDAQSFRADSTGTIYASCPAPSAAALATAAAEPAAASASIPGTAAAAIPIASVPVYHSRPGATKIIFLDFNGHIVTGTQWNTTNSVASYDCMPYDLDGDYTTFSDEEQTRIQRIWARVAEDYAPFDVDVTTEQPATFTRTTARALITRNTDRNGVNLPSSGGGGVAYLGVFGQANFATAYSPAFIYANSLGSGSGAYTSEAVAHEIGHNFGLSHDGAGSEAYYDGHGSGEVSWGPVMGSPYGMAVSQWSKGEYTDATNDEDDFSLLASQLGYRPDDAGNTTSTAGAATISGTALSASGVIEAAGDIDVRSFTVTGTGTLSLTALPYIDQATGHTGNLDIQLELLSSTGTSLALNNPATSPRASLTTAITPGTYYIRITPSAAGAPLAIPPTGYTLYGSRGQFFIDGTLPAPAPVTYATFLVQYFTAGEQLDNTVSGPAADPDRDGLNNLIEYALARNPRQADAPTATTAGLSGSYLTLTYDRRLDTSDLTYTVQASDDLVAWTTPSTLEQISATPLSSTLERVTVRNTSATGPRLFLRLQVTAP